MAHDSLEFNHKDCDEAAYLWKQMRDTVVPEKLLTILLPAMLPFMHCAFLSLDPLIIFSAVSLVVVGCLIFSTHFLLRRIVEAILLHLLGATWLFGAFVNGCHPSLILMV